MTEVVTFRSRSAHVIAFALNKKRLTFPSGFFYLTSIIEVFFVLVRGVFALLVFGAPVPRGRFYLRLSQPAVCPLF